MSEDLRSRLCAAGLPSSIAVVTHANRRTLVTLTPKGVLRVHAGYHHASDEVIAAIVRWARPRQRRQVRIEAGRILAAFPVHEHHPSPPSVRRRPMEPADPADPARLARIDSMHQAFNTLWFGGELRPVTLRLSARMRRRLGEFRPAEADAPAEISISRRHLRRHGWRGVAETLLHEMVHQWQSETGRPLGHDRAFRRKCEEIGIDGRAVCDSESMLSHHRRTSGDPRDAQTA